MKYDKLSIELVRRMEEENRTHSYQALAFRDEDAIRRDPSRDRASIWRPTFVRDVDKILHSPFYNRYSDKTQVFSFYRHDDITRRALHVQLVSRIARTIGGVLHLNLDLIEAIALGHDIGHTPFGHAGEKYLSEISEGELGICFCHNVHSVRVLDRIFSHNLTLQTLNGILAHNGETELPIYEPQAMHSFEALDAAVDRCLKDVEENRRILPSTLEGCVVRISDLIAYLGKDRQDARRAHLLESDEVYGAGAIGSINAEMINNLTVSIIENSYGRPYIALSREHFEALAEAKRLNYEYIYRHEEIDQKMKTWVYPMFERLYARILEDLREKRKDSPVYRHHVELVAASTYPVAMPYEESDPRQIAIDFIASMTDDYFVDLYQHYYPDAPAVPYIGYFSRMETNG
ncbi:MAG: HD domain-containing protein [Clostridia bacterium]|nr:HD domain-containing protein [Clostridia bacterium]